MTYRQGGNDFWPGTGNGQFSSLSQGAVNTITTGVVWARANAGGNTASVGLVKVYDKASRTTFSGTNTHYIWAI